MWGGGLPVVNVSKLRKRARDRATQHETTNTQVRSFKEQP